MPSGVFPGFPDGCFWAMANVVGIFLGIAGLIVYFMSSAMKWKVFQVVSIPIALILIFSFYEIRYDHFCLLLWLQDYGFVLVILLVIGGAVGAIIYGDRKLGKVAARLFNDVEKAERAHKDSRAARLYRSLLQDFSRTKYITNEMKSIVQDRIQKIEARMKAYPTQEED